jgi:pyrroline-5-carboxylate reductase
MKYNKIAIIGAGNMGSAIAKGILKSGLLDHGHLVISDIAQQQLDALQHITTATDNIKAARDADMIITAVKPYHTEEVIQNIKPALDVKKQVLVCVAAGIHSGKIQKITGNDIPLFMAMPNTAIGICESMTCLATPNAPQKTLNEMISFFNQLGKTFVIEESLMGAATVLASCGTAFALRFIRAAMAGGVELGFKPETSRLIAAQMMAGASQLMFESHNNPEEEIDKVTTPKGITIAGLNEMEHHGFTSSVIKGFLKSFHKVEEMLKKEY